MLVGYIQSMGYESLVKPQVDPKKRTHMAHTHMAHTHMAYAHGAQDMYRYCRECPWLPPVQTHMAYRTWAWAWTPVTVRGCH